MPYDATTLHPHQILLSGDPERPPMKQAYTTTIVPGMLICVDPSHVGLLIVHPTAAGNALPMFADVNVTPTRVPMSLLEAIDLPYQAGESVEHFVAETGDVVYAWLTNAATVGTVVEGSPLCSHGDGTLQLFTALTVSGYSSAVVYGDAIVGYALEAVSNGSGAGNVRLTVRVA